MSARSLGERLRWRIAYLLDRSPRFCWADLVSWAMGGWAPEDGIRNFVAATDSRTCQVEGAAPGGCCYCGKFRDKAVLREGTGA